MLPVLSLHALCFRLVYARACWQPGRVIVAPAWWEVVCAPLREGGAALRQRQRLVAVARWAQADLVTCGTRDAAQSMFNGNDAFDREVNGWNVGKVTRMNVSHALLSLHVLFSRFASASACQRPGRP